MRRIPRRTNSAALACAPIFLHCPESPALAKAANKQHDLPQFSFPVDAPFIMNPVSISRLDSVQMLRGIAALAVVFVHLPQELFPGLWGVDLFFVISGFIICYVTERDAKDFLLKRAIRVIPLYWAGTLAVYGVALAAPKLLGATSDDVGELLKSLFFVPFIKKKAGPSGLYRPVLFLGWTLNMEIYFYLLFALSARLSHRYRALICSLLISVVILIGHLVEHDSEVLRFYSKAVSLSFVYGMAAYALIRWASQSAAVLPTSLQARAKWIAVAVLMIAAMVVLSPFITGTGELQDDYRGFVLGIPAAVCFIALVVGLDNVRLPMIAVIIGDASYSLYLFHPYVIRIARKAFPGPFASSVTEAIWLIVTVATCCGCAIVCYQFFEKPLTELLRRRFVSSQSNKPLTPKS